MTLLGEYRTAMRQFAAMTNLAVWYAHIDVENAFKELQAADRRGVAQAGGCQRRQGPHP